jgi:hypothetical protein
MKSHPDAISLLKNRFPSPLGDWMSQFVSFLVPDETRAVCSDCPMVKELPLRNSVGFTSKARCCTYVPKLSNFQVGAILNDKDPASAAGRERVSARLSSRRGVTPLGIFPDVIEKRGYRDLGDQEGFGRSDEYICPYYIEGGPYGCGIWKYRSSTCSTWFCRHVLGAPAKDYWKKIYRLLEEVELEMRMHCLVEMKLSPKALARLLPPISDETPEDFSLDDIYHDIWGSWLGREQEFYQACAEYVASLSWKDIQQIAGPEFVIRLLQFQDAEARLQQRELPDGLVPGRFYAEGLPGRPEITRVVSYLKTDVLHVPTSVMLSLYHFDGRPSAEVLKSVKNCGLDEETVRMLYDFKILTTES